MAARPAGLLGTAAFQVAFATATAFGLVALLSFAGLYFVAHGAVLAQIDSDIARDAAAFRQVFDEGGAAALRRAVERRSEPNASGDAFYLLLAPTAGRLAGAKLAGNLPQVVPPAGLGWIGFAPGSLGLEDGWVRARGDILPDQTGLVVGRDPQRLAEQREVFVGGLLWAELGTLMLGLLFGYLAGRHALRGVETIAREADRIGAGELDRRIPPLTGHAEIARIAVAVNAMLDRIGALTSSLRQVTDDIAHDLRTPLGRLRQSLERAGRQARTIEEMTAAMEGALAEADAIIGTFNALLGIAQIEAQDRRVRFGPVDLSALVLRVGEMYAPAAEDAGHRLDLAGVAGGIGVSGDADLLAQLTANLVENALRHTPSGSTIRVGLASDAGGACLAVSDDGPGIPPDAYDRVLGRFVRLDSSRARPGTGLGLALVKAIADLHRAELQLSDAAPGLRVRVRFPR